jgi:hypothetical protein
MRTRATDEEIALGGDEKARRAAALKGWRNRIKGLPSDREREAEGLAHGAQPRRFTWETGTDFGR